MPFPLTVTVGSEPEELLEALFSTGVTTALARAADAAARAKEAFMMCGGE